MIILLWAVPFFAFTILIEWLMIRSHRKSDAHGADQVATYDIKDAATSITMGIGNLALMFGVKTLTLAIFFAVYELRIFEVPTDTWWAWLLLIPADDFVYYWYHRAGHEVRFFWAAHVTHHSSQHYNLSTALRQTWTGPFIGWVFWVPLLLIGFHPLMIFTTQAASLLYQYWLHTELVNTMGPFGLIFNTPSHHRVHHGRNPRYLDRNHGGILIIWDRLFGTFEAETERPDYGLTTQLKSHNPLVVAFHEWRDMARDLRQARTWRGRLGTIFGRPGWREDGTGKTAKMMRQAFFANAKAEPQLSASPSPTSAEASTAERNAPSQKRRETTTTAFTSQGELSSASLSHL